MVPAEQIRRHILCTGNLFVTLQDRPADSTFRPGLPYLHQREEKGIKDVATSRIEQSSPFANDLVRPLQRVSAAN
jgi:2-oxoglutarate dehydrogenase E1 component